MSMKLGILISHPIQYLVPFFRILNQTPGLDVVVFYTWNFGVQETFDLEFGQKIRWDIPLLDGYRSVFLKNYSFHPSSDFFGQINPGIIKALYKEKCDAVLCYGWNSFTNWIAFLFCFIFRIRILLRGESPLSQELKKPLGKRIIKKILLWPLFRYVSSFLYIGEENRKFYRFYGVPERKLNLVPYAVDNARFFEASEVLKKERVVLRALYNNTSEDEVIILFSGKLIPKKRPMDLLGAFFLASSRLIKDNYHMSLIFVGDGFLRKSLEEEVVKKDIKRIYFTGFKNQTELPQFYSMADIFVLPSQDGETWGLVVNEAMCFGLPIIVSDVVGCGSDLVHEDKNGFIIPLGDKEKLAHALEILVRNKKLRMNYGMESRRIVSEYSFERGAQEIQKILISF